MKSHIILLGVAACVALASSAAEARNSYGSYGHFRSDGTYVPPRGSGGSNVFVDPRSDASVFVNPRARHGGRNYYGVPIPHVRSQFDSDED
jgi:hypothetical protein